MSDSKANPPVPTGPSVKIRRRVMVYGSDAALDEIVNAIEEK